MSDIRPFRALRPHPRFVAEVASPPYDVINSEEARAMAQGKPNTFLHVNKAEIDFPPEVDPYGDQVYEKSAANLQRLLDQGIMFQEDGDAFYVYQLQMGEHVQTGLVFGASVQEYEDGLIKKHEFTRRDKEDDRARHVEKIMANAGPAFLTYRAYPAIDNLIQGITESEPEYNFTADDGIRHALWVVREPELMSGLRTAFQAVPALYIADGHHRTASAFRVRNNLRAKNPNHTGDELYNHFLAVAFPGEQLRIMDYNRVVKDLAGHTKDEFLSLVAEKFTVEPADQAGPPAQKQFGMYLDKTWYRLTAKPGSFPENDPVLSLDVSILQENLLNPILGIQDPRTDKRIDFVGGIRGTRELERRCGLDMVVAFAMYPTGVDQLMAIADSGNVMPPKSTWFEPKLRSGIVVRTLRD